jgi:hypothetical protein
LCWPTLDRIGRYFGFVLGGYFTYFLVLVKPQPTTHRKWTPGNVPTFSGEKRDFDVWKNRFCAFGLMQSWAPAMLRDDTATSQQQVDLYSTLIFALQEDDLSLIDEKITETDKNCGVAAWAALVDHHKDDGIYSLSELSHDTETQQAHGESSIQYLKRLVRLQRQFARVGDNVHDRRVIVYLVKGMLNKYHSITDMWTSIVSAWM